MEKKKIILEYRYETEKPWVKYDWTQVQRHVPTLEQCMYKEYPGAMYRKREVV